MVEGSDIWPWRPQARLSLDGANGGLDGPSYPVQGKSDSSSRIPARYHPNMKQIIGFTVGTSGRPANDSRAQRESAPCRVSIAVTVNFHREGSELHQL